MDSGQVKVDGRGAGRRYVSRVDRRGDEGAPGYVITVDYRESVRKGGTWPGGRAAPQGNPPRGVRARRKQDDARYIYISYTLLAELHLFEQVNADVLSRGTWRMVKVVIKNLESPGALKFYSFRVASGWDSFARLGGCV